MKQQTIKEALSHEAVIQEADYRLYLIRDKKTVFYVGQAKNTYNRFLSHMGLDGRSGKSHVGEFIIWNAPASGMWLFMQYTLEECREVVQQYRSTLPELSRLFYENTGGHYGVDEAEEALIKLHRPCLNTAANPDPLPIPRKYRMNIPKMLQSAKNEHASQLSKLFGIK
jgi:hypothetical protein